MKKLNKSRIFAFIASLFVLTSLFSFSSSAASMLSGGMQVNFSMNSQYITNVDAKEAFERLEVYYLAPGGGYGAIVDAEFGGQSFSIDFVGYGGDWDYSVRIVNNSYWQYDFTIVAVGQGTYSAATVPAYSNGVPGVFTLDLSDVKARYPSATVVNLWFEKTHQPIYKGPTLNTSYAEIIYQTPNGVFRTDQVYAPSGTYGSYTYQFSTLVNNSIINSVPEFYDGYRINMVDIPYMVIVDPDKVNTYVINYSGEGKIVSLDFYDQNGTFITRVEFTTSLEATLFEIPKEDGFIFAPMKVNLTPGVASEQFNVYKVDFTGAKEEAYQSGLQDGLLIGTEDLEHKLAASFNDGYNKGFDDGYADGSVITGEERNEIAKDYNAITGFFDGLFNALFQFVDRVFNGVGFGGVTLGNVVWTIVMIVITVTLVKHIF